MTRDRYRIPRTLFFLFVGLSCVRAWLGPIPLEREAHGQLANTGARLTEIINQGKRTHDQMKELIDHLKMGVLKVEVTNPPPEKK